jgi:hypothetical protein
MFIDDIVIDLSPFEEQDNHVPCDVSQYIIQDLVNLKEEAYGKFGTFFASLASSTNHDGDKDSLLSVTTELELRAYKLGVGMFLFASMNNGEYSLRYNMKCMRVRSKSLLSESLSGIEFDVQKYVRGIALRGYLKGIEYSMQTVGTNLDSFMKLYNGYIRSIGGSL